MSEILSVNTPSFDNVYDQWITFNCSCGDKIDFWGDIPHDFKCPGCGQKYLFDDVKNGTITISNSSDKNVKPKVNIIVDYQD